MRAQFTGTAGVKYQVRAWTNVTAYTSGFKGLLVHDAGAAVVVEDATTGLTDGWELREVEITPASTGLVSIRLNAVNGTTYWDDVSVEVWDDRSSYVLGDVSWSDGKSRDLDEPQAGSITFRLSNANGEWIPNSADSLYPDSPFLLRRFRWSVDDTAEGVWYVVKWDVTYPAGTEYSEVQVTCVDGFELLALDALDLLSPATATSYEEVVMHDQPFAYYNLDDVEGTQVKAVTGDDMVSVGRPLLKMPGLLVGGSGTALRFTSVNPQYARAPIEAGQFGDSNAISVGGWFQTLAGGEMIYMHGPTNASADRAFVLKQEAGTGLFKFYVSSASGVIAEAISTTAGASLSIFLVMGTWDGQTARIYVNGVEEDSMSNPFTIGTGTSDLFIYLGASGGGLLFVADEIEYHETCLSPARIMARYEAGTNGFDAQLAGERVAAVADSGLWAEANIQAGALTVAPVMEHGQSRIEEIRAAVKAEMPDTHFYFDGDGNPVYLGWDYKGASPYNEAQGTFGPSDIPYQDVEIVYDDEMFNEVTVGHEATAGEETQHTATDEDSIDEFYRRAHSETGLILTEHEDAEAVAAAILEAFHEPKTRVASLTVNGAHTPARTQILERSIGDLIRVKGVTGTPDVLTTILGRSKTLTAAGHLTCTWSLARGIDATADAWYLGMDSYSELGQTTTLG